MDAFISSGNMLKRYHQFMVIRFNVSKHDFPLKNLFVNIAPNRVQFLLLIVVQFYNVENLLI